MSLSSIVEAHDRARAQEAVARRVRREQLMRDASLMNQAFLNGTNKEVLAVYANQRAVDAEVKKMQHETAAFVKETTKWVKMYREFNAGISRVGDVETWAKNIQMDLGIINDALSYVCEEEMSTD